MHQIREQEPNLSFLLREKDSVTKKSCFYLCQNKAHCRTLILIFGRLVSSIKEAQTYRSQREMVISNSTTPPTYLCINVQQIVGFIKSSLLRIHLQRGPAIRGFLEKPHCAKFVQWDSDILEVATVSKYYVPSSKKKRFVDCFSFFLFLMVLS